MRWYGCSWLTFRSECVSNRKTGHTHTFCGSTPMQMLRQYYCRLNTIDIKRSATTENNNKEESSEREVEEEEKNQLFNNVVNRNGLFCNQNPKYRFAQHVPN